MSRPRLAGARLLRVRPEHQFLGVRTAVTKPSDGKSQGTVCGRRKRGVVLYRRTGPLRGWGDTRDRPPQIAIGAEEAASQEVGTAVTSQRCHSDSLPGVTRPAVTLRPLTCVCQLSDHRCVNVLKSGATCQAGEKALPAPHQLHPHVPRGCRWDRGACVCTSARALLCRESVQGPPASQRGAS